MLKLTEEEEAVIRKVLISREIELLFGAEELGLTEEEELRLLDVIGKLKQETP